MARLRLWHAPEKRFGRARISLAISALLVAGALGSISSLKPAAASSPPGFNGPLVCNTSAAAHEASVGGGNFSWSVNGRGSCVDRIGTYIIDYSGSGTSKGLGLCSGLLVQNLRIPVSATFVRTGNLQVFTETLVFSAPVTTYPLATPVLVSGPGALIGAGLISTHYFLNCPPKGSDDALIDWVEI